MGDKFSIIITTYNDEKKVNEFFSSIKNQSIQPDYVIVIDGGSTDNTVAAIRNIQKEMTAEFIIAADKGRLNISQGFNEGIRRCPTELLFLMGVGNTYPNNFFEEMLITMQTSKSEIVQCLLKGVDSTSFAKSFNTAFLRYFPSANNHGVLVKKKIFAKIGGFYENFVYAGEDFEFFFIRAKKMNISTSYTEKTCVYWDTPTSFKEYLKKNQVNAIADIQCVSHSKLYFNIVSRLLIIFFTIFFWKTLYFYILFLLLLIFIVNKIQLFNLKAILLRLHFLFLPAYLYIKNAKYFNKKYLIYNYNIPNI